LNGLQNLISSRRNQGHEDFFKIFLRVLVVQLTNCLVPRKNGIYASLQRARPVLGLNPIIAIYGALEKHLTRESPSF
jgi:hypothetical protein